VLAARRPARTAQDRPARLPAQITPFGQSDVVQITVTPLRQAARRAVSLGSFVTYRDGSCRARPGCRGTGRGTSANHTSVRCVLSARPYVASVQVERLARPSGPLLIRGFRVRAPGAPPAKTSFVDLVAYLACERGIRSRKVTASPSHQNLPSMSGPVESQFAGAHHRRTTAGRCRLGERPAPRIGRLIRWMSPNP